ncbi:hypothetical protein Q3G72_016949 [Acer saccharum]|nr:hypothetical protein Q3G72_016949 [Acer saccharum]
MVSLCPLVSRLSLATRTGATAARILKGKTVPALLNRGVEANRVIETHSFSVKSYFDGDDCGGGAAGKKENNASVHPSLNHVSLWCSSDFKLSRGDFDVIIDWSYTYKDSNAFLGGRHGKMIKVEVDSKILEVPSGILPSSIKESDKEAIYRLHMEDQEVYTPGRLAKDYNTAAETVDEILFLRDMLTNREPEPEEGAEMYRMYKENTEIYTIERLAKDFKFARKTAHLVLFCVHALEPKSSPSDGQEIPSLPFDCWMKDTWARWSANSNAFDEDSKVTNELMKKYKKQFPRESSDDKVHKLFYSQVVSDSEEE